MISARSAARWHWKNPSVIPGFGLTLGFTLAYLTLIILIPLAALAWRSASLGGSSKDDSSIGKIMGPAFSIDQVADAVETIVNVYLEKRTDKDERFLDMFRRVGLDPFKEKVYGNSQARRPAAE